jgi:hypothetical protein
MQLSDLLPLHNGGSNLGCKYGLISGAQRSHRSGGTASHYVIECANAESPMCRFADSLPVGSEYEMCSRSVAAVLTNPTFDSENDWCLELLTASNTLTFDTLFRASMAFPGGEYVYPLVFDFRLTDSLLVLAAMVESHPYNRRSPRSKITFILRCRGSHVVDTLAVLPFYALPRIASTGPEVFLSKVVWDEAGERRHEVVLWNLETMQPTSLLSEVHSVLSAYRDSPGAPLFFDTWDTLTGPVIWRQNPDGSARRVSDTTMTFP